MEPKAMRSDWYEDI